MEEQKNEQQSDKRKNVRWEYVLEPFNKPTYWDHAALSTEERRARGRRTVLVKEPKLEVGAFVKSEYDELICNVVLKEMKSREVEDPQTSPELLSSSIIGLLEQPFDKEILKDDDEDDDNVPIYKLLNKTPVSFRGNTPVVKNMKGIRCAERGMSAMLLWQHEFYFVLESEELCRRQHSPPKPYLYQALEFRKGSDLPEEAKVVCRLANGLKLTYDLPVGKSVGILRVRACWHDVVFRNELGFTESMFLY